MSVYLYDMNVMTKFRRASWFDGAYRVGIVIKGFDGLVELVAGVALLVAPGTVHWLLSHVAGEMYQHHTHTGQFIATYVARLDGDLARSGLVFLIAFLIGHGIVKLALVYCLLQRIVWAYPYALGFLGLFLVYQLYVLVSNPTSIGMWLFTLLDVVIIWLVWGEWRDLRETQPQPVQ